MGTDKHTPTPLPWERLPGETPKAWRAFCIYRDMGPTRTIMRTVQALGLRAGAARRLQEWSSRYRWAERVAAYDAWLDAQQRAEREAAVREMARRHAELAMALLERVRARVDTLRPEELTPSEVARWLEVAARLERLSRGEPETAGRQQHELDVRGLSWAELAEFLRRPTEEGS